MIRMALAVAALAAIYALTLVSVDPVDLATGVLLACAVLVGLRRFPAFAGRRLDVTSGEIARRIARSPAFAGVIAVETVRGTWDVALVVLGLRPLRRSGIVAIPFEDRTPTGAIVTALTATITPGEFLIEIDEERAVILMHVLDATDPDAVRAGHHRRYRRWQRGVAP